MITNQEKSNAVRIRVEAIPVLGFDSPPCAL